MFKGSFPALVTPMSNGQVDFEALEKLVAYIRELAPQVLHLHLVPMSAHVLPHCWPLLGNPGRRCALR